MLCIISSLYCKIYLQTCVLCVCSVISSTLFHLYACAVVMLCIQIITLLYYTVRLVSSVLILLFLRHCSSLYLCCCHVVYTDHHFTVISLQTCVLCVCPVISATLFIVIPVLLSCCVYRSSLYCNISSHMCNLCCSCYYFNIVLSLYLYCCYVV
jgi:hypothetical protein